MKNTNQFAKMHLITRSCDICKIKKSSDSHCEICLKEYKKQNKTYEKYKNLVIKNNEKEIKILIDDFKNIIEILEDEKIKKNKIFISQFKKETILRLHKIDIKNWTEKIDEELEKENTGQ